jgi:hypothetical protein
LGDAVNVDLQDRTVADLVADARRLPFRDNAFTAVIADQLIEHLGYAGAIYALAEWFRVLRPGGELIIETPDPAGSFKRFLAARSPAAKDRALGWIFGDEAPGYSHTFLYPRDLLELMVVRAGFEVVEWREPLSYVTEPGQRLVCRALGSPVAPALALVRTRMAGAVLDLSDPSEVAELENGLIEHLGASVTEGAASSAGHVGKALVIWARATAWWFGVIESQGLEISGRHRAWSRTAREMAGFGLSGRLTALLEPLTSDGSMAKRGKPRRPKLTLYLTYGRR